MIKLGLSIPNTRYEGSHNRASNIDIDEDLDQSFRPSPVGFVSKGGFCAYAIRTKFTSAGLMP